MRSFVFAVLSLSFLGCAPATTSPATVVAMVLTNTGVYAPKQITLNTVSDIVGLQGSVATLVGGAKIVIDANDPLLATNGGQLRDDQLAQIYLKNRGASVRASYIGKDGTLWPADFDTWDMVSAYYNFEKSFEYFQTVGVQSSELATANVFYSPTLIRNTAGSSEPPETDSVLWVPEVQGFAVLPISQLSKIPLAMNLGVIAHEFGRRVFNIRVYQGAANPPALALWGAGGGATPAANTLLALEEGFALWDAYGASCLSLYGCTTRFWDDSLDANDAAKRDISRDDLCMNSQLFNALTLDSIQQFVNGEYPLAVGAAFGSALYHAGESSGQRAVLEQAVLNAYSDSSTTVPGPGIQELITANLNSSSNFTMAGACNAVVAHVTDPTLQTTLCNQLIDKLGFPLTDLPNCPASASGGTTCPSFH